MDVPSTWRDDVPFSERLGLISKIKMAYKTAYPEISLAESQAEGTAFEKDCMRVALSKDDYYRLCDAKVASLAPPSSSPKTPSSSSGDSSTMNERFGDYEYTVLLNRGASSAVYKAYADQNDAISSEVVALKVTTPSQTAAPHNPFREARILRHAVHPCVVRLIAASFIEDGQFLMVFPFLTLDLETWILSGNNSAMRINSHTPNILHDIFSGLAHIHSLGIIHRDIKPANILLASVDGPACLADFGVAWMPGDPDSEPADEKTIEIGTTSYRPPEILFGHKRYGYSLDMWAAGCIVAEVFQASPKCFFDSGELGSDLALIFSIFTTLGTPTIETWPEVDTFPSWGMLEFTNYPAQTWDKLLPLAPDEAKDLVGKLLVYESGRRLTASEVLQHPYFDGIKSSATSGSSKYVRNDGVRV